MNLADVHSVHFIGIGGIGMSAVARFFHLRGKQVTGFDRTETELTRALVAEGMEVWYEAKPDRLEGVDLVVYTPAVPASHAERMAASEGGLHTIKRSEALGMISRAYRTIAIAGTHGKTTTTSLTAYLLRSCGVDATAFIGGISRNFGTNFVNGESEWVVVEADEFDRSFLTLKPDIAVVTSIDPDHLDIYGDEDSLLNGFRDFANQILPGGHLFICDRAERLDPEAVHVDGYGLGRAEVRAVNVEARDGGTAFGVRAPGFEIDDLFVPFPGRYNLENALAAICVCKTVGVQDKDLRGALRGVEGVKRRYEVRYDAGGVTVIDDYAHHPEEIRAVLEAVRSQYGEERQVIVAFQPHLYSRTRDFAPGFADALSLADAVVLLDIYPAREAPIPGVSSELIYGSIRLEKKARAGLDDFIPALQAFKAWPAVVMVMGAGDIGTRLEAVIEGIKNW